MLCEARISEIGLGTYVNVPVDTLPYRTVQKDLPKPKHEVYLRGVRPVPPCVLTEGPRRGTNFGGCLATAKPNFGQPESVSLLT